MSWASRVVWQEGMFLRAQHFQQQDRWAAHDLAHGLLLLRSYAWGFSELQLARSLLDSGRIGVSVASGIFEDGTRFSIPGEGLLPSPLTVPDGARDVLVYLAIPVSEVGRAEFDADSRATRFVGVEAEVFDTHTGSPELATIRVGQLAPRLLLGTDDLAGYHCLSLARIVEVMADRRVVLDSTWIPPVLTCSATPILVNLLIEFAGILHQRSEAIAGRLSAVGARSNTEIADFMLLQSLNGWQSLISHLAHGARLHPEELFRALIVMAGELATFTETSRRPESFAPYRHDDLRSSIAPVAASIRRALSSVLEQTAVQIPLKEHRHGVRVGTITDRSVITSGTIVLAVRADVPLETLRRVFPTTVKIGAVENIRDLVNVALPGVELRLLPVAPRQMPFIPNALYFELERHSSQWESLKQSAGFAIHVSHDFPNLALELWAIRA